MVAPCRLTGEISITCWSVDCKPAYHAFLNKPNWFVHDLPPYIAADTGKWLVAQPWQPFGNMSH